MYRLEIVKRDKCEVLLPKFTLPIAVVVPVYCSAQVSNLHNFTYFGAVQSFRSTKIQLSWQLWILTGSLMDKK